MLKILSIQAEDQRFTATIEWLMECIETESTRDEGLRDLYPQSDFMRDFTKTHSPPYTDFLSDEQKSRLKLIVFSSKKLKYNFTILDLIYIGNENEVHNHLLWSLKTLDQQRIWMADDFMKRLLYKKRTPALENILKQFTDIKYEPEREEDCLRLIHQFVGLMES